MSSSENEDEEALGARTPLARRGRAQPRARGAAERGHGQARAQDAARGRALRRRRRLPLRWRRRRRLRLRVAPPARARLSSPSAVTAAFHACGHRVASLPQLLPWQACVPDCCLICLCISRVTLAPDCLTMIGDRDRRV